MHNPLEWVDPFGLTGKNISESVDLYRAVGPDELADIQSTGKFNSPFGIETKYFTTSGEKASEYAKKAVSAFGDEPYTIIKTTVPKDMLKNPYYFAEVDGGMPAYVFPNKVLENASPSILNFSPIPR